MANIIPFRGLYYNPEKVPNLSRVITPPCERIDETAQTRYYAEHPANIVRLESGLSFPRDSSANNRYTRAARYLDQWIQDDILCFDSELSLYIYQQGSRSDGPSAVPMGLIALLKIGAGDGITLLPSKESAFCTAIDRLELTRACRTDFSPLFALYEDRAYQVNDSLYQWIDQKLPLIDIIDESEQIHKIWSVNMPEVIHAIQIHMENKSLYIPYGQHRYNGRIQYQQELYNHGYEGGNYIMTVLVNSWDTDHQMVSEWKTAGSIEHFSESSQAARTSVPDCISSFGSGLRAGLMMCKLD